MKRYAKYSALACILVFGCADANPNDQPDAGLDADTADAEAVVPPTPECPDYLPDRCDDTCVSLKDDPANCGTCEHACGGLFSDYDCYEYECRCGVNATECTSPAVCFREARDVKDYRCIIADITGDTCDPIEGRPCVDDTKYCVYQPTLNEGFCTHIECGPERCNGIDDDCDGDSDEVEDTTESCYNGPEGTRDIGICEGGYSICVWNEFEQGMTECMGEILPIPEEGLLACDGLDNNCDGCEDGRWEDGDCISVAPTRFNVVFFLDISGSMAGTIAEVVAAMIGFATTYAAATNISWALVVFPGDGNDSEIEVRQDLADYTTFMTAMTGLTVGGGGYEANWDAIYMAATDELPLSFTPGAQRVYIMFTDEIGQSYYPDFSYIETNNIDEATMCASLTDEVFAVFSASAWSSDFDACGVSGSPFILDSFTSTEDLVANIELTFDSACGE